MGSNSSKANQTILLSTASGFVGSATLKALKDVSKRSKKNLSVRYGTRDIAHANKSNRTHKFATPVQFDLRDQKTVKNALKDVDVFVLIPPGVEDRGELSADAIRTLSKLNPQPHVVLVSVPGAEGGQILFARQFKVAQDALEECGVDYTITQLFAFQDNIKGFKEAFDAGVHPHPLRDGAYPPVAVEDVAMALAKIATDVSKHRNKQYVFSGPESLDGKQQARAISRALDKKVKYVDSKPADTKESLLSMGWPEWQVDGFLELYDVFANNWAKDVSPDLEKVLGQPPKTLEETARAIFR